MNPIENGDRYLEPLNMGEAGKKQNDEKVKAMTDEIYKIIAHGNNMQ